MKRMEPVRKPFGPKITGSYPSFKTASANPIDKTIQLALMARDIEQMEFSLETGGMHYTKRLYTEISQQLQGLFFKDNGPIIGVQLDNEYMASSAPWEMTTGISNEWIHGGHEGEEYPLKLRELALECGITPAFFTMTAWGSPVPDSIFPLWGCYAYMPWLFYSHSGEHPASKEYLYRDYHNNESPQESFKMRYPAESRPYACCEMGGGMMCSYYYRFQLPYKSVDAMANIQLASGCNFLGYYMFQGGSNPLGKHGAFLNEGQVPKISYDYQAALGEYGQIRESYSRLKSIHYFCRTFGKALCGMKTELPESASAVTPEDLSTLRFAVRTDGRSGFLFVDNFQDHRQMPARKNENITVRLPDEDLSFTFDIADDENAILPFHFDMQGIDLIRATAQPITVLDRSEGAIYVFMMPDGMTASFTFERGAVINETGCAEYIFPSGEISSFTVEKSGKTVNVMVISRELANKMFLIGEDALVFSDAAVMADNGDIRLESTENCLTLQCYPADYLARYHGCTRQEDCGVLGVYEAGVDKRELSCKVEQVGGSRFTVELPEGMMDGLKDVRLQIDYMGDIGHAFINGVMISDNFFNGATWEIGLREYEESLKAEKLTLYIAPLREGANVNVESTMAARIELADAYVGNLSSVRLQPVYEMKLSS